MFQRGSSFIFLFRNRETKPLKWIKISSLTWEGKTSSKNFSREKWINVRDSCLCQSPRASSTLLSREIPSEGDFTWPKLVLGSKTSQWIYPAFPALAADCFFPKKQINKRSKGRSHVEIQSIHPSCHPRAIKLSYFLRRLKGHLISWKEGLMSQKMNELSASADNPWENNTCNVDLV